MHNRFIALSRCGRNSIGPIHGGKTSHRLSAVYFGNVQWVSGNNETDKRQKNSAPSSLLHPITVGDRTLINYGVNAGISTQYYGHHRTFSTTTRVMRKDDSFQDTIVESNDADALNESFKTIDSFAQETLPAESIGTSSPPVDAVTGAVTYEFERLGWPSDYCIDVILKVHESMGLDIASSVCVVTLAVRTLMVPLFVHTQRSQSRMAHLMPELNVLKARIDTVPDTDTEAKIKLANQIKALFRKYNVNPFSNFALLFVQMPVFMTMFFALKRMPDIFPTQLANESFLWCTDLGVSDPYFGLPLLTAGSFLGIIEMSKQQMKASSGPQGELMVKVMRGLGLMMIPVTAYFPVIMFTYWLPNNLWSFAQTAAFQNPTIRKQLGIWEKPKPAPGAPPEPSPFDALTKSFRDASKSLEGQSSTSADSSTTSSEKEESSLKESADKRQNRMFRVRGARPVGSQKKGRSKGKRR